MSKVKKLAEETGLGCGEIKIEDLEIKVPAFTAYVDLKVRRPDWEDNESSQRWLEIELGKGGCDIEDEFREVFYYAVPKALKKKGFKIKPVGFLMNEDGDSLDIQIPTTAQFYTPK